mgnify:CR=1 FL=1
MKQIVAMGGGYFEQGNVTPAAEFNIYVDPHAARLVLDAGIPFTLIPLDCTHQALTTAQRVEAFRTMQNKSGPAVAAMLDFFERFDEFDERQAVGVEVVDDSTPQSLKDFVPREIARWTAVVKASGAKVD